MMKFFRPLGFFIGGQALLLLVFLFMPALGTASDELAANTTYWTGWGWTWVVNSTRLLVIVGFEMALLFIAGMMFIKGK